MEKSLIWRRDLLSEFDRIVRLFLSGAVLAAALLAACASKEASNRATYERTLAQARQALLAAGDADSLAAAALLIYKGDASERLALVTRAAAAAPERPDLAWLQLQQCIRVPSCDVEPIETQLRRLDPGNGAAWSGSLARSLDDAAKRDSLVAAIASSERFDVYWNALIFHTANALIKSGAMPAPNALVAAIGGGSAQAIPAFQPLTAGCKGPALEQAAALVRCRRLTAVLRHGDTYITEMLGQSLAKRLWQVGSPEYQEVVDARRVTRYRCEAAVKANRDLVSPEGTKRYLELLATHRTEQEVSLAELTRAGLAPNPGAHWKDRYPES
jgi:hypothetical protein